GRRSSTRSPGLPAPGLGRRRPGPASTGRRSARRGAPRGSRRTVGRTRPPGPAARPWAGCRRPVPRSRAGLRATRSWGDGKPVPEYRMQPARGRMKPPGPGSRGRGVAGGGSWAGDRGRGRCRPGPRPWDHGGPPGSRQSPRITAVRTFPAVTGLPAPGRTIVMGVVNVTPDSFSDGGEWLDPEAAIQHGRDLIAEGADLIDVGGESTRPGAVRPSQEEELRRVLPVTSHLGGRGAVVSVDTMRPDVAAAAVAAGAAMINDVSGGRADPR